MAGIFAPGCSENPGVMGVYIFCIGKATSGSSCECLKMLLTERGVATENRIRHMMKIILFLRH